MRKQKKTIRRKLYKRKTYKKKTYNKKTYKRKNYKRKTYKRKTYKRIKQVNQRGGDMENMLKFMEEYNKKERETRRNITFTIFSANNAVLSDYNLLGVVRYVETRWFKRVLTFNKRRNAYHCFMFIYNITSHDKGRKKGHFIIKGTISDLEKYRLDGLTKSGDTSPKKLATNKNISDQLRIKLLRYLIYGSQASFTDSMYIKNPSNLVNSIGVSSSTGSPNFVEEESVLPEEESVLPWDDLVNTINNFPNTLIDLQKSLNTHLLSVWGSLNIFERGNIYSFLNRHNSNNIGYISYLENVKRILEKPYILDEYNNEKLKICESMNRGITLTFNPQISLGITFHQSESGSPWIVETISANSQVHNMVHELMGYSIEGMHLIKINDENITNNMNKDMFDGKMVNEITKNRTTTSTLSLLFKNSDTIVCVAADVTQEQEEQEEQREQREQGEQRKQREQEEQGEQGEQGEHGTPEEKSPNELRTIKMDECLVGCSTPGVGEACVWEEVTRGLGQTVNELKCDNTKLIQCNDDCHRKNRM